MYTRNISYWYMAESVYVLWFNTNRRAEIAFLRTSRLSRRNSCPKVYTIKLIKAQHSNARHLLSTQSHILKCTNICSPLSESALGKDSLLGGQQLFLTIAWPPVCFCLQAPISKIQLDACIQSQSFPYSGRCMHAKISVRKHLLASLQQRRSIQEGYFKIRQAFIRLLDYKLLLWHLQQCHICALRCREFEYLTSLSMAESWFLSCLVWLYATKTHSHWRNNVLPWPSSAHIVPLQCEFWRLSRERLR